MLSAKKTRLSRCVCLRIHLIFYSLSILAVFPQSRRHMGSISNQSFDLVYTQLISMISYMLISRHVLQPIKPIQYRTAGLLQGLFHIIQSRCSKISPYSFEHQPPPLAVAVRAMCLILHRGPLIFIAKHLRSIPYYGKDQKHPQKHFWTKYSK